MREIGLFGGLTDEVLGELRRRARGAARSAPAPSSSAKATWAARCSSCSTARWRCSSTRSSSTRRASPSSAPATGSARCRSSTSCRARRPCARSRPSRISEARPRTTSTRSIGKRHQVVLAARAQHRARDVPPPPRGRRAPRRAHGQRDGRVPPPSIALRRVRFRRRRTRPWFRRSRRSRRRGRAACAARSASAARTRA